MAQFVIPDFIKNSSVETIHKRMRDNLPKNIDVSEGSHPWNLTYPDAYEKAWIVQFCLLNSLKLIWPKYSYSIYSDYHAETRGLKRRNASYSTGYLLISGKAGTYIPQGSVFSTEQVNNESVIEFETTESVTIEDDNTPVTVSIAAVVAGKSSNVSAGTITVNSGKLTGISSITNPEQTSGGYDAETDDTLNARVEEYDQNQDESFIGNDSDYIRWAKSVVGVGEAVVIDPEDNPEVENDSAIVTLIIIDSNGNPASVALCAEVYNHIMKPTPLSTTGYETAGQRTSTERLAPPGVHLVVHPPFTMSLLIGGLVELDGTNDIDAVIAEYVGKLQEYLLTAIVDGEIRYSKITSFLSEVTGVADHKNVTMNGGTANIQLSPQQIPIISAANISFSVGLVDG